MTIAELEQKTGMKRSTIHHYIRCGLLHEPYRTSQTMAYYNEGHLQKLEMIQKIKAEFLKTAKTTRVPLDYIKTRIEDADMEEQHRPMVRTYPEQKRTKNQRKKRDEIVEIAMSLYSKKGFYRTSVRDITKKAGISSPTFYHYFPDKRELFMVVIDHVINEWREKSATILAQEMHPTKRTLFMFRTFQEHYPRVGEILNYLRAGVITGDMWAQNQLKHVYNVLMENILKLITAGIERGTIRQVNPALMSYFLFMIDEAAVQKAALDNQYSIKELMSFVADMIAFGFLTSKGRSDLSHYRKSTAKESVND